MSFSGKDRPPAVEADDAMDATDTDVPEVLRRTRSAGIDPSGEEDMLASLRARTCGFGVGFGCCVCFVCALSFVPSCDGLAAQDVLGSKKLQTFTKACANELVTDLLFLVPGARDV